MDGCCVTATNVSLLQHACCMLRGCVSAAAVVGLRALRGRRPLTQTPQAPPTAAHATGHLWARRRRCSDCCFCFFVLFGFCFFFNPAMSTSVACASSGALTNSLTACRPFQTEKVTRGHVLAVLTDCCATAVRRGGNATCSGGVVAPPAAAEVV